MQEVLIIFQIILAILIVLIVLVNVTKGSEYGAVFRGAEAIFGGEGPTSFLNKVTMLLVVLFFLNSLLLTKISTQKSKIPSIVTPLPSTKTAPVKKEVPPLPPQTIPTPPKKLPIPSEK